MDITVPCYVLKTTSPFGLLLGHPFMHDAGSYVDPVTGLMTYRPHLAQQDITTTSTLTMRTHTGTPVTKTTGTITNHCALAALLHACHQHPTPHPPMW